MLPSSIPPAPAAVAQALPSASPCPQAVTGLVTFAVDPAQPVAVKTSQSFIVALRVVADAGYVWTSRSATPNGSVRFDRAFSIPDVAYLNADRPPSAPGAPPRPPMVGGESTQYFLYTAIAPGTASLVFDLHAPGSPTPQRTATFTVTTTPNALVC